MMSGDESHTSDEAVEVNPQEPAGNKLVKINLPRFEEYLLSIKDQLARHEQKLQFPDWIYELKTEADKIGVLSRKLEHTMLDINTIKDFIYCPEPTAAQRSKQSRKDPLLLLQGEVECLKIMCRRIELFQSEDLNIFKLYKTLQIRHNELQAQVNKLDKDETIQKMRVEFNQHIEHLTERLNQSNVDNITRSEAVYTKIQDTASELQSETDFKVRYIQAQIDSFLSDDVEDGEREHDPEEAQDRFGEALISSHTGAAAQISSNHTAVAGVSNTTTAATDNGQISPTNILKPSEMLTAPSARSTAVSNANDVARKDSHIAPTSSSARNTIVPSGPGLNNSHGGGSGGSKSNRNTQVVPPVTATSTSTNSTRNTMARSSIRGTIQGKFVTVEKFLEFQREVDNMQFSLYKATEKMQHYGCAKICRFFTQYQQTLDLSLKRRAFTKFQANNEFLSSVRQLRRRKQATEFIRQLFSCWSSRQISLAWAKWVFNVGRLREGARLKNYVYHIAKYWHERVRPDVKKYLNIWKNFTVESFRSSLYVGNDDVEATPYDEFAHLLNGNFNMKEMKKVAHRDLQRRMSMRASISSQQEMQAAMEAARNAANEAQQKELVKMMTKRIEASENDVHTLRKEVMKLYSVLDGTKADITAKIDLETNRIVGGMNNFKSKVTTQLVHAQDAAEKNKAETTAEFARRDEYVGTLLGRIEAIERDLEFHKETQASITRSQKEIRAAADELLLKQSYIDSKFKAISNEIVMNTKAMSVGIEEVRRVERNYKEITEFYDSEVGELRTINTALGDKIEEIIRKNKKKVEILTNKLTELEQNQEEVFPRKPTIPSLFNLCCRYESIAVKLHHEGGVSAFNHKVEKELNAIAKDMAIEATRIAYHIVTTADKLVIDRLVHNQIVSQNKPANIEFEQPLSTTKSNNKAVGTLTVNLSSGTGGLNLLNTTANNNHNDNNNKGVTNNITNNSNNKVLPISTQIQLQRDVLLKEHFNNFVDALQSHDMKTTESLSYIKTNARIIFHSKLKIAVDVLICKHNTMYNVLDTTSALTRKPYVANNQITSGDYGETLSESDACVACSRPMSGANCGQGNAQQQQVLLSSSSLATAASATAYTNMVHTQIQELHRNSNRPSSSTGVRNTTAILTSRPLSATVSATAASTDVTITRGKSQSPTTHIPTVSFNDQQQSHSVTHYSATGRDRFDSAESGYSGSSEPSSDRQLVVDAVLEYQQQRLKQAQQTQQLEQRRTIYSDHEPLQTDPAVMMTTKAISSAAMASGAKGETFHSYINRPPSAPAGTRTTTTSTMGDTQQQQQQQRGTSATRHRDALRQSLTIHGNGTTGVGTGIVTSAAPSHGSGFKFTHASEAATTAREELALSLANNFRKDVTIPSDIRQDPNFDNRHGYQQGDIGGTASAHGSGGGGGMHQSQSDSNMLGARRLVGARSSNIVNDSTMAYR